MSEEQIEPIEVQEHQPTFWQRLFGGLSGDSTPTVLGVIAASLGSTIGILAIAALTIIGVAGLAITTFTFGYEFIGEWLLRGWVTPAASRSLSGFMCVMLFDFTYTVALYTSFRVKSNAQRAICLLAFVFAFSAGFWASLTGFNLVSEAGIVDEAARAIAQQNGRFAFYLGFANLSIFLVLNFVLSPANVATMLQAVIEGRHASQRQIGRLIMEEAQEGTYYQTIREEAYRIGRERGRQAVRDFGNEYRLNDGTYENGHNRENFPQA